MISLPLPVFVSLVLAFILIRGFVTGIALPLLILLGLCAVQAAIASFNLLYDVAGARVIQVGLASLIGPVTYIAYVTTTRRAFTHKFDSLHLGAGPVIIAVLGLLNVLLWDGFLTLWFAGHGIWIIASVRKGADSLPNVPLETAEGARRLWLGAGIILLLTALVDVIIIASVIAGFGDWVPRIVTSSSALILLGLAFIGLAQPQTTEISVTDTPVIPEVDEESATLFARATSLLETEKLYLDPDLNLTRLARRLHVPVKKLSAAINQNTGENVSRLINGYRIKAVCIDLTKGVAVTQAMFAAGFSTKSNFNAEFLRVKGMPPRKWLAETGDDAAMPR